MCIRLPFSPRSIAGVPSSQALPVYFWASLLLYNTPVCVPAVIGGLAVWRQNKPKKLIQCRDIESWKYCYNFGKYTFQSSNLCLLYSNTKVCAIKLLITWLVCFLHFAGAVLPAISPISGIVQLVLLTMPQQYCTWNTSVPSKVLAEITRLYMLASCILLSWHLTLCKKNFRR